MATTVPENKKISPFMVMFIIHPIQVGVGILGFQSTVVKEAGYDAWISVLIAGIGVHLLLWIMYGILNRGSGDIVSVHRDVFGKGLGGVLSMLFILLFFAEGIMVLLTYAEIVQVWMFPTLGTWIISLIMLFLAYYAVTGGFRVVVGVCFFGFLIPFIGTFLIFIYPLQFADFHSFLPIWSHSVTDLFGGAQKLMFTFLGFESLLVAYPFIQHARASQKWAHVSNLLTIVVYFVITVVTFAFYSEAWLKETVWSTLSMMQIVHLPFMERFDYYFISIWLLTILPNIVIALWASSRGSKNLFNVKQRHVLIVLVIVAFIVSLLFDDRKSIARLNDKVAIAGLYLLYGYLPILWLTQFIKSKVRKT